MLVSESSTLASNLTLSASDSGGNDMKEAFEQVIVCMFGYMTELESVDIDAAQTRKISAEGRIAH